MSKRLVKTVITRIYQIITYSWHRVTHMWPVLGFPHIFHATTY